MAVQVSYTTGINAPGTSAYTRDFFVPSGVNLVTATIHIWNNTAQDETASAVSFGGADMTPYSDASLTRIREHVELWYQVTPASASTYSFEAHYTGDINNSSMGWHALQGADETTPISSATTRTFGSDVTQSGITIASSVGNYCLDFLALSGSASGANPASNQEKSYDLLDTIYNFSSVETAAASVGMHWEWNTARKGVHVAVDIAAAEVIKEVTLQDSFTFSDQGTAQYSDVITVTDGTPGFDDGIDYSTQNAAGVITAQLADSFTYFGRLVRDYWGDRHIQDSSIYIDAIASESTQPLWSRAWDTVKESWSRKTDSNRETWSRATDTNRETY